MDYAVIRLQGQQFRVAKGDQILVGKLKDSKVQPEVLMTSKGGTVVIGAPTIAKNSVKLTVVEEEEKGDKLYVRKFRSKSRYRKTVGFRPKFSRLQVENI